MDSSMHSCSVCLCIVWLDGEVCSLLAQKHKSWRVSSSPCPLPLAPTGQLQAIGQASILFSPSTVPSPHSLHPRPCLVTSIGANRFLEDKATVVCSPEATWFYESTDKMAGMESIAIMAVSLAPAICACPPPSL